MKLVGALTHLQSWTPAESAALVEAYARGGIRAARVALPHRSMSSLYHEARRQGVSRRRRWTAAEDKRLRLEWGSLSLKELCRLFGRPRAGVCLRARHLGLRIGCPDGYEYLSRAARRTGYSAGQLRRILQWAGVGIRESYSFVARRGRHFHVVDPYEVDEAVAAWHRTETLECASRRLGCSAEKIKRAVVRAGLVPQKAGRTAKAHYRVESAAIDAALRGAA